MNVDILKTCAQCGQQYWWTAQEQEDFAQRGRRSPKRCPACRPARKGAPAHQAQALARRESSSTPMTFPELQQPLITDDIRQLIAEASAPIEDRSRTLVEWLNNVDIREQQLAKKIQTGRVANVLVKQRAEFMASVSEIATRADAFRRERREAHLAALELEDRIAERTSLRDVRLSTQLAVETLKHRKLMEPEVPPVPERERIIRDHRQNLKAKATVRREALGDLESEVKQIFNSRMSGQQKVAQIRAVLEVYQQDESVLSKRVRAFLFFMEGDDEDD